MLLFSHIGITLATVAASRYLFRNRLGALSPQRKTKAPVSPPLDVPGPPSKPAIPAERNIQPKAIDYRFVFLGSMLPDIIDKPTSMFLFGGKFRNGRLFAHSLIFGPTIGLVGSRLRGNDKSGMLLLSFCSTLHLALDRMWSQPGTLLWPILGRNLHQADFCSPSNSILSDIAASLRDRRVFVPEIVGALITAGFALKVLPRRKLGAFVRTGTIE